jgi:hypothetical protein
VPEWVPTFDNLQYNSAVTGLNKVVFRLIDERRRQLAGSSAPVKKKDLLTRLLQVRFWFCFPPLADFCVQERWGLRISSDRCWDGYVEH